ncbi:hypothetical protein [Brucella gallinifaecis]|uniref:hypothetical protein n=1 Tax=Brucella gallinifaecis TaxID=215590 RepID=UPI0023611DD7|nr:hypothetical protein [Brucella gallinifaecis]
MNFGIVRNYLSILAALIVLVALITTLLFYYNSILDSVFEGHKALQSDENLINFFEKTFGLAVTILVSSVALVIALLSVKIMKQQTALIEKQTDFSRIQAEMSKQQNEFSKIQIDLNKRQDELATNQHNFEASFRVNDYVTENFAGTIEVYERVNSIFSSMSVIRNYQYRYGINFLESATEASNADYEALVKVQYDKLIDDVDNLLSLVRLRARDEDFDKILDYTSSDKILKFAPFIELRYRSTTHGKTKMSRSALYVCLFEYWKNNVKYPEKERFTEADAGLHDVVIYEQYKQSNVAIEIASANFKDIIHAIDEIRHIVNSVRFTIDDNYTRYDVEYDIVPHILLAAIILYSPDRIIQSLDSKIVSDEFYLKLLWETLEKKIPYHHYIFKVDNTNIYPDHYNLIETLISRYTLEIKKSKYDETNDIYILEVSEEEKKEKEVKSAKLKSHLLKQYSYVKY